MNRGPTESPQDPRREGVVLRAGRAGSGAQRGPGAILAQTSSRPAPGRARRTLLQHLLGLGLGQLDERAPEAHHGFSCGRGADGLRAAPRTPPRSPRGSRSHPRAPGLCAAPAAPRGSGSVSRPDRRSAERREGKDWGGGGRRRAVSRTGPHLLPRRQHVLGQLLHLGQVAQHEGRIPRHGGRRLSVRPPLPAGRLQRPRSGVPRRAAERPRAAAAGNGRAVRRGALRGGRVARLRLERRGAAAGRFAWVSG